MIKDEALKLALEVLENLPGYRADIDNAITTIKAALAQTSQRPWVGLTDDDWKEIEDMPDTFDQGVSWCLAKLKEKNT